MSIPIALRNAVDDAVSRSLRDTLGTRGFLLGSASSSIAATEIFRSGAALLQRVLRHFYGQDLGADEDTDFGPGDVEFGDTETAIRISLALAFGSVAARLLRPPLQADRNGPVDLTCAVFNLGVGLVDGLCDGAPEQGRQLLRIIEEADLVGACREVRPARRLCSRLPAQLAADPTVMFAARVIDGFFELLHATYPGPDGRALRDRIGARLEEALAAERSSIDRSARWTRDQLTAYSRTTSVLPFEIIEHLSTGEVAPGMARTGMLLGEAMWRIDDLVDLVQDADTGALNAILVAASDECTSAVDGVITLDRILTSDIIGPMAENAAELLDAAISGTAEEDRLLFLSFVQRYAGLTAR